MNVGRAKYGILLFVVLLILGSISVTSSTAEKGVDYTLSKTDTAGDSEGLAGDTTVLEDADIIKITSKKEGDDIVLTLQVSGTIYTTAKGVVAQYDFFIDIDDDDEDDWQVQTFNMASTVNNTELEDDNNENEQTFGQSGNGTDTLTVQFPLSYISDHDTVTSWNMYAETSINIGISHYASDTAPNSEFEEPYEPPSDDADDDGIPDDYENANGMDPSDPSDADDDNDGDKYPNIAEYNAGTDPNDASDYPDATTNGNGNGGNETGDRYTFTFSGSDCTVLIGSITAYEGTFTIDESASEIDIHIESPSEYAGKTSLGIYKIVDGDTLWLSMNEPGVSTRPSAFTDEDTNMVWKLSLETSTSGETELEGTWQGYVEYETGDGDGDGDDDDEDDGGLPGFEAVILFAAFGAAIAVAAVSRNYRK